MSPTSLRLHVTRLLLAGGCVALPMAACHGDAGTPDLTTTTVDRPDAPRATVDSVASASAARPARIADSEISAAVERAFADEPMLRADHLRADVRAGVAGLSGSVGTLLAKERAVSVAETIRGVRSIVDEVDVAPAARTDGQLKSDVTSALRRDDATRPYAIDVTANRGTVTLSGTTDSWQAKSLIADVAKAVPGVKVLVNAVDVRYASTRPEQEIAADVRERMANDAWLDGDALVVQVNRYDRTSAFPTSGTAVQLVGTVGSVAEKSRARSDAWVAGVDRVDDEGVVVDWFAQNDQRRATDGPVRSDSEIARAVRDAFRLDPRLKTFSPHVAVRNGEVLLSGTAATPRALRAAEADANETLGVWRVRSEVRMGGVGAPTDAEVERSIRSALANDPLLPDGGKSLQVASVQGRVTLRGSVPTGFGRFEVVEDVGRVAGVSDIEDDIAVAGAPADIKASIEERLLWDPRVERDLLSVMVAPGGVTTLTGTVDRWSEIKAADGDARRGGASRVVNMLKLKQHPEVVAPSVGLPSN